MFRRLFLLPALALAACSGHPRVISLDKEEAAQWRRVATEPDRDRLRTWHDAWDEALPLAREANAAGVAAESKLLDPDHAIEKVMPPAGSYRCRTFKLGAQEGATRQFAVGEWEQCRIEDQGKVRTFDKLSGTQRPSGLIFPETDARAIFLGTMAYGDETTPIPYGADDRRDLAGYLERIEEARWRLVFPRPAYESIVDVIELVPEQAAVG